MSEDWYKSPHGITVAKKWTEVHRNPLEFGTRASIPLTIVVLWQKYPRYGKVGQSAPWRSRPKFTKFGHRVLICQAPNHAKFRHPAIKSIRDIGCQKFVLWKKWTNVYQNPLGPATHQSPFYMPKIFVALNHTVYEKSVAFLHHNFGAPCGRLGPKLTRLCGDG